MNKYITNSIKPIIFFGFSMLIISCMESEDKEESVKFNPDVVLQTISDRVYNQIEGDSSVRLPRNVVNGEVDFTSAKSWTSGFFPGILWMLKDFDASRDWSKHAIRYTEKLQDVQYVTSHHDLGFMLYGSYGKAYEDTRKENYKEVLVTGAKSLASRYDEQIGLIKSWDRPGKWQYPVIIDNMMNLEYFFWTTAATGDSSFYDMAYSHALKTMDDHYREDTSSYHVVDYDTVTAEPIWKGTHQGYADESVWSRGQAWGLYGFTMAYRETGDERFLQRAQEVAAFMMNHPNMPGDKIPYWDLKDPEIPNAPRDVSAATIIASALLELSEYDADEKNNYLTYAEDILRTLNQDYRYKELDNASFFYLDQSVGNMPKGKEVSVPIIYADYYYIEALLRLKELQAQEV